MKVYVGIHSAKIRPMLSLTGTLCRVSFYEFLMTPVAVSPEPTLDQLSRDLVRDLQSPNPVTYWTDFLLSSLAGWTAFVLAVRAPFLSVTMLCWSLVSMFALYRGLLFVHEVSHFTRGGMRGFETAWNL